MCTTEECGYQGDRMRALRRELGALRRRVEALEAADRYRLTDAGETIVAQRDETAPEYVVSEPEQVIA